MRGPPPGADEVSSPKPLNPKPAIVPLELEPAARVTEAEGKRGGEEEPSGLRRLCCCCGGRRRQGAYEQVSSDADE